MVEGITQDIIAIYQKLQSNAPIYESIKELKGAVKMNNNQLDVLLRSEALRRFEDGTYMINDDWLEKIGGGE